MSYLFARLRAYPYSPKLSLRRPQLGITTFVDTVCLRSHVTGWLWQVSYVGDVEAAAVDLIQSLPCYARDVSLNSPTCGLCELRLFLIYIIYIYIYIYIYDCICTVQVVRSLSVVNTNTCTLSLVKIY